MTIVEKLSLLREIMERDNLDAYIVSGTDPHNSEYLPAAWKQREWISGFTGSFGTVVITKNDAGLWTDTRYFIQAEQQLKNTGIQLHKLRIPGAVDYPEWLATTLPAQSRVGIDSFCISVSEMAHLKQVLEINSCEIIEKTDLLGDIWKERPALPDAPLFTVPTEVAGKSVPEKIDFIRQVLQQRQADYFIFSALDEIAWLYNIRCNDIEYNPVAISYAVVGKDKAWLFVKRTKVSSTIYKELQREGIEIQDYHQILLFLDEIEKGTCFCIDSTTLNYAIYNRILSHGKVKDTLSPIILAKAIKNDTEIAGIRDACIKDGVAMVKFFYWLYQNLDKSLTECGVSERLTAFRAANESYVSDSFENISAYGSNAALPHYSASPGRDAILQPKGLYLVDSGGQYTHGTTDITRTIPLGELTTQEKEDYTLVLKGMIALSAAVFPEGTRGCNIDAIARYPLWQTYRNFGHGTGHGVGFFLNVHEGPQAIRQDLKDQALLPGMVTSNEPGIYRENSHGIRHENMLLCVSATSNEFGRWYKFETLTLCYFDTSALCLELLTPDEIKWLNDYHQIVYKKLSPYLTQQEASWLAEKTKLI